MFMTEIMNSFTTIRITRDLKDKLDKISSKNESYCDILDKIVSKDLAVRGIEDSIVSELKNKRYVDFDDIEW